MFNASPGLNVACAMLITEMFKQLPRERAIAIMDHAAEVLEKGRNQTDATINGAKLLRGDWLKAI